MSPAVDPRGITACADGRVEPPDMQHVSPHAGGGCGWAQTRPGGIDTARP